MGYFKGKRVLVTGGSGFLGSFIVEALFEQGANIYVPRSSAFDLRLQADVRRLFLRFKPEIVIHAAATGGGIGFMRRNPASAYYDNIMMNTLVLEESRLAGVEKFVGIGTVCSYPKFAPVPFKEEDLWSGYPEETNAPYGLAKKMMLVQTQAYREQYGFNGIHLLLVNLYGPGDDFSLERGHVIPALIRKFREAVVRDEPQVVCWGDGSASREFLYVEDAAEAVLLAAERYNKGEPVNIGSGFEISIRQLAGLIADICGFRGRIVWDASRPNGQPRRRLDASRALREFGFCARTELKEGLQKTIAWYRERYEVEEDTVCRHEV